MNTVIAFTTRHQCAARVAERLAGMLPEGATLVNLKDGDTAAIWEADRLILGGSVYIGKTQKELIRFVEENLERLVSMRPALFLCGAQPDPAEQEKELSMNFPPQLLEVARARKMVGYEYDFSRMNFLEKMIIRKVSGCRESVSCLSGGAMEELVRAVLEDSPQ